jgi:hypothetical protein
MESDTYDCRGCLRLRINRTAIAAECSVSERSRRSNRSERSRQGSCRAESKSRRQGRGENQGINGICDYGDTITMTVYAIRGWRPAATKSDNFLANATERNLVLGAGATRKWRRNPMKSLKTDWQTREPAAPGVGEADRSDER